MATINTHGMTMHGLKKAVSASVEYGEYGRLVNEFAYDMNSGEVWVKEMTPNSWTNYDDPDVVTISTPHKPTMQALADRIRDRVEYVLSNRRRLN